MFPKSIQMFFYIACNELSYLLWLIIFTFALTNMQMFKLLILCQGSCIRITHDNTSCGNDVTFEESQGINGFLGATAAITPINGFYRNKNNETRLIKR